MQRTCPRCGYEFGAFEQACPRCARRAKATCQVCGRTSVTAVCARCGKEICASCTHGPEGTALCPRCAPVPEDEDRVTVAPGQEITGSVVWFKRLFAVIRGDPAWGVLLGLLSLSVVYDFITMRIFSFILAVLILWGVFTLQRWAYHLVIAFSALGAIVDAALLIFALRGDEDVPATTLPFLVISIAISLFTIGVLIRRRQYFS